MKLGRLGQLKDDGSHGTGKSSSENEKEDESEDGQVWGRKSNISLLDQHTELKKLAEGNCFLQNKNLYSIGFNY